MAGATKGVPDWSQFVIEVGGILQLIYGVFTTLMDGKYVERMIKTFGECFDKFEDLHLAMEPFFNDEEKIRMETIEKTLINIRGLIRMRGKGHAMNAQFVEVEKQLEKILLELQNQNPILGSQKRNRVPSGSDEFVNFKSPKLADKQQEYAEEFDMGSGSGYESERDSYNGIMDSTRTDSENEDDTYEEQDETQPSSSTPNFAKTERSGRGRRRNGAQSTRSSSDRRKAQKERNDYFKMSQKDLGEQVERMTTKIAIERATIWNSNALQLSLIQGKTGEEIAALPNDVKKFFDKMRSENAEQRCLSHEISKKDAMEYAEKFVDYRQLDQNIEEMFFSTHPGNQEQLSSPPSLPPTIKFATKLHLPPGIAGKEIIKTINERKTVYSSVTEGPLLFNDEKHHFVNEEIEFYMGKNVNHGNKVYDNQVTLSTPIIDALSMNEEDLQKAMLSFPICLVENIKSAWKLDEKLFEFSALTKNLECRVDVLHQLPQPTSSNFVFGLNNKMMQYTNQILYRNVGRVKSGETTLAEFCANYNKLRAATRKTFAKLVANVGDHEKIMQKFGDDIKDIAIPLGFLTNFDLKNEVLFSEQIASTSRMPRFLQPSGHGGFLDYPGEILLGLNWPQIYIKPPGARTTPHLENNGLTSININFGEGDCIWFAVPFEYSARFEEFVKNRLGGELGSKNPETIMYHESYWPNEFELLKAGIPLIKFVQKPYQMVFVNYGTYHWVQSNGFCVNFSWNVAQNNFFQLATAGLTHDHFTNMGQQALMPIEHTIWKMVEKKVKVEKKLYDLIVRYLMRSIAHAEEERLYLVDRGIQVKEVEDEKLRSVQRCLGSGCEEKIRKVVFNYFAMKDETTYCLECYTKESKKDGFDVYEVRKIAELVQLYDNYKFETLVDGPAN